MRFCADLSRVFGHLPLMDRFAAAQDAGFQAVELGNPYEAPVQDLRDRCIWAGLQLASIDSPPPNYVGGSPGYAADPEGRFRADFRRTLRYAGVLRPHLIRIGAGPRGDLDTLVENLRWASDSAGGQQLAIAPGMTGPDDILPDLDAAADVIEAIGSPNLGLMIDATTLTLDQLAAAWPGIAKRAILVRTDSCVGTACAWLVAQRYSGWLSVGTPARAKASS